MKDIYWLRECVKNDGKAQEPVYQQFHLGSKQGCHWIQTTCSSPESKELYGLGMGSGCKTPTRSLIIGFLNM
ncbi:hypothetical protein SK128_002097 [Halocaridina rubra]|uniref:Uncharacterized protein n=1 Tax=Halocaridina rubra TaxID=373956 RepID=A0AAN9A7E0_HALRR